MKTTIYHWSMVRWMLGLLALLAPIGSLADVTFEGRTWYDYRDSSLVVNDKGTLTDPIVVSTPEQLAQVAWLVNEQNNTFEGKIIVLAADIDLTKEVDGKRVQWMPIGLKNSFRGTFLGIDTRQSDEAKRFCITGMYIDVTYSPTYSPFIPEFGYYGLFGRCDGFVGYLQMSDASLSTRTDNYSYFMVQAGLLCGSSEGSGDVSLLEKEGGKTINLPRGVSGVSVEGSILIYRGINSCVGGIFGLLDEGEITHSTAKVHITCSGNIDGVGGICGRLGMGSQEKSYILDCAADVTISCQENLTKNTGGIVGELNSKGFVMGSSSTGTISGEVGTHIGGICGYQMQDSNILACASTVTMKPVDNNSTVGGISGLMSHSNGDFTTTIDCCVYAGHIDGSKASEVGGICGRLDWERDQHVVNSLFLGTLIPTADASYTGAIFGYNPKPIETAVACYYDKQMFSGKPAGGTESLITIKGLSTRDLTSGDLRFVNMLPTDEEEEYGFALSEGFYPTLFCNSHTPGYDLMLANSIGTEPANRLLGDAVRGSNTLYQPVAWTASVPALVRYGDYADDFASNITVKNLYGSWEDADGRPVEIYCDCLFPETECITVDEMTATAVKNGMCMIDINGEVNISTPMDEWPNPIDASRKIWLNVTIDKVWDGVTKTQPDFGTGKAEDPYIIKNGAQLAYAVFNNKVGEFYEQICDIRLNEDAIGKYGIGKSSGNKWDFNGEWKADYNGRGHFVLGAVILGNTKENYALFGNITDRGSVTSLGLVESSMTGVCSALAYNMDGKITNCIVQGVFTSLPIPNQDGQYDHGYSGGICYAVGPNNPEALIEDCVAAVYSINFLSDYTPFVCLSANNQGKVRNCLSVVPTPFADNNFANRDQFSAAGHSYITDCYWLKGYEAADSGFSLEEICQALGNRSLWKNTNGYFPMLKSFSNTDLGKLLSIPIRTDLNYVANENFLLGFSRHLTFEPGLANWTTTASEYNIDIDGDMGIITPVRASYVIGEELDNPKIRQVSGLEFLKAQYGNSTLFIPMCSSDGDISPGITFIDDNARQACLAAFDTNQDGYLSLAELKAVTNEQTLTAFQTWRARQIKQFPEFRFFKSVTELTSQLHGLYSLESVQLPYALQTIGSEAFKDCDQLKEITVSSKVTNVKSGAFFGSSVENILVDQFNTKFVSRDGVLFTTQKELVSYPNGRHDDEAVIEGTVKRIADGAFYKVPNMRRLYFDTNDYTTVPRLSNNSIVTDDGSMLDVFVSDATYDQALFTKYQRDASWSAYDRAGKLHQYYPLKIDGSVKGLDDDDETRYFGTFCIGFDTYLPQELTPYIVEEAIPEEYKAVLARKEQWIPATAAVIVAAQEPGVYRLSPLSGKLDPWPLYENRLVAVDRKGRWINQKDAAQGSIMTLATAADGITVGFYPEKKTSIEPYKAYLPYNTIDLDPAIAANAHYDIFYKPTPSISFIDGADNSETLTKYDGQVVNVTYDRVLRAIDNGDGTWTSKAYTICLPYDCYLVKTIEETGNAMLYHLVSVTDDYEFIFTNDFNYISAGYPYVVVVNKGEFSLDAKRVTLRSTPIETDRINKVYDTFESNGTQVGWWRGTFRKIDNEEGSQMHAFGLSGGRWKIIRNDTEAYRTGYIPTFRSYYVPLEFTGNWVYDSKFIYTEAGGNDVNEITDFPADTFDGDLPDGYGDETVGISPVIHTIDRDGTHRYFDLQGRLLPGRPNKGLSINNGKKVIKK